MPELVCPYFVERTYVIKNPLKTKKPQTAYAAGPSNIPAQRCDVTTKNAKKNRQAPKPNFIKTPIYQRLELLIRRQL